MLAIIIMIVSAAFWVTVVRRLQNLFRVHLCQLDWNRSHKIYAWFKVIRHFLIKDCCFLMPVDSAHVEVLTGRRPNQIKILLLAYYRSGSTYTSELFRNHPDAFYLWVFVMLCFSNARLLKFYSFFREALKSDLLSHRHWTAMNNTCIVLRWIFILLCTYPVRVRRNEEILICSCSSAVFYFIPNARCALSLDLSH